MRPLALKTALIVLLPSLCTAFSGAAFDGNAGEPISFDAPTPEAPGGIDATFDERYWVTVAADSRESRSLVASLGVSIEAVLPERVAGVALPEAVAELRKLGMLIEAEKLNKHFRTTDFPRKDSPYHNYEELEAALKAIAAGAPDLVSMFSIGKSVHGLDLWALRLNTSAKGSKVGTKPAIVFMGTHHAREHLSTEVPLLLAKHLVDNRAKEDIAALLETRDIYFLPMVNPDGVEYDISDDRYHMHRKNMRSNSDGSTGVDLNRNYGFMWGTGGSSANPRSDIYKGEKPFSEPETRAVKAFVEARPNINILLTYHSFSELILYPWGHKYDPIEDKPALAAYKAMAGAMSRMTGYTPKQSSGLYIASGDTTDWSWGALKIFSFTFELTPKSMWSGGFYPGTGAIAKAFQNNIRPALYLIDLADNPMRAASVSLTRAGLKTISGGR